MPLRCPAHQIRGLRSQRTPTQGAVRLTGSPLEPPGRPPESGGSETLQRGSPNPATRAQAELQRSSRAHCLLPWRLRPTAKKGAVRVKLAAAEENSQAKRGAQLWNLFTGCARQLGTQMKTQGKTGGCRCANLRFPTASEYCWQAGTPRSVFPSRRWACPVIASLIAWKAEYRSRHRAFRCAAAIRRLEPQ